MQSLLRGRMRLIVGSCGWSIKVQRGCHAAGVASCIDGARVVERDCWTRMTAQKAGCNSAPPELKCMYVPFALPFRLYPIPP